MANLIKPLPTPDLDQNLTPKLLGKAVKARRTQTQLRLDDAAMLCNIAKQTLQDIEHGLGTSKLETVLQVCNSLGIKLKIIPWIENNSDPIEWY